MQQTGIKVVILKASHLRVTIFLNAWHSIEIDIYRRNLTSEASKHSFNFYGRGRHHSASLPLPTALCSGRDDDPEGRQMLLWMNGSWERGGKEQQKSTTQPEIFPAAQNWKILMIGSSTVKKITRKMLWHGRIFKILFGLPNRFIVTLFTSNIGGNLSIKYFYIINNLEKKIYNRKHSFVLLPSRT